MDLAMDIAMKFLNLEIALQGFTFTFMQLLIFCSVVFVLLAIMFRAFK